MKKKINLKPHKKSGIEAQNADDFFNKIEEDFEEMDKLLAKFQAVVEHHLLPQTYKAKRVSIERTNRK